MYTTYAIGLLLAILYIPLSIFGYKVLQVIKPKDRSSTIRSIGFVLASALLFLLFAFYTVLVIQAISNGSVHCFDSRRQRCNVTYSAISDLGSFWSVVMFYYSISVCSVTFGLHLLKEARNGLTKP